jgi:hypothetical protein
MAQEPEPDGGIKSTEQIRSALAAVRAQSREQPAAGPLTEGSTAEHRIVLAEFHDSASCKAFQQQLSQNGMLFEVRERGQTTLVCVDAGDRVRAGELLANHLQEHPDVWATGHRRDWDGMIFGAMLGAVVGTIFLAGQRLSWLLTAQMLACALLGSMIGRTLNLLKQTVIQRKLQFGLQETLTLVAIIAMVMFLYQSVGRG